MGTSGTSDFGDRRRERIDSMAASASLARVRCLIWAMFSRPPLSVPSWLRQVAKRRTVVIRMSRIASMKCGRQVASEAWVS